MANTFFFFPDDSAPLYKIPAELDHNYVVDFIRRLPVATLPQGLGLNENSAIAKNTKESLRLLNGVLMTQPQLEKRKPDDDRMTTQLLERVC